LHEPNVFVPFLLLALEALFLHFTVIELIKMGLVSSSFKTDYVYIIYTYIKKIYICICVCVCYISVANPWYPCWWWTDCSL